MACFGDFVRLISSASGLNGALTPIGPIKCQRERKTPQNRIENQQPQIQNEIKNAPERDHTFGRGQFNLLMRLLKKSLLTMLFKAI